MFAYWATLKALQYFSLSEWKFGSFASPAPSLWSSIALLHYALVPPLNRLWLKRLTGEGDHPDRLDAILYDNRVELTRARMAEDDRLIAVVEKFDDATFAGLHSYRTTSGMPQAQVLADILLHLFNHQTHHRGQAHACLSILTGGEPPPLDLLVFQRGGKAPDLGTLILNV